MKKSKLALSLILSISLTTMAPADLIMAAGSPGGVNAQNQKASAAQTAEFESEILTNTDTVIKSNESNTTQKKINSEYNSDAKTNSKAETSNTSDETEIPKEFITETESVLTEAPETEQPGSPKSSIQTEPQTITEGESDTVTEPGTEESGSLKKKANRAGSTETETKKIPDLDYVLGRPMTQDELDQQHSMAPQMITLPSFGMPALNANDSSASRARASFPSYYSSRDLGFITGVRDQRPWDTCWAFASLACGETSLLKKGLATSSLDLSERHLAYFFYNTKMDPLQLTLNDRNLPISPNLNYLETGGNNLFTIFTLAKWLGAADESVAPYINDSSKFPGGLDSNLAYSDKAHLQNAYIIPSASMDDMKSLILSQGAIAANLYIDPYNYFNYYNPNTAAYCYVAKGNVNSQNHTVEIVGWDDNYKRTNFLSGKQPSRNGAWLAKNSWGSNWGKDGYFWISYEDAFISSGNGDATGVAFDFEAADNYDHNYQYDGSSGNSYNMYQGSMSIANVYTAKGNPKGADELLEAVSFAHYTPGVNYSIQIYKNLKDASNPTSGTKMLTKPQKGVSQYAGYQTITLKQPVTLSKGDTFAIVIQLTPPGNSPLYIFMDRTYTNGSWIQFISSSAKNQSFVKKTSDKTWQDAHSMTGSKGDTVRIKAFTSDLETVSPRSLSLKASKTSTYVGRKITLDASFTPKKSTVSSITWKSSNSKVVKITSSEGKKATASAVGYGSAKITATTSNGLTKYITIKVTRPNFEKVSARGYKSINLSWYKVYGAKGYAIYRSTSKDGPYNKIATIKNSGTTTYIDKSLKTGQTYYYQLRSYKVSGGKNVYSNRSYISSCKPAPQAPKLYELSLSGSTKAKITWKSVSGASGYQVYRSNAKNGEYKRVRTITGKTSTTYYNKLKDNGTYYYKVRAYRVVKSKKVYGAYSEVKSITK